MFYFNNLKAAHGATLLAALTLLPTAASAMPTISSVSEISDSGDTSQIVIEGSNFGTKAHPRPLYFFNFEDGNLSQSNTLSHIQEPINANGSLVADSSGRGSGHILQAKVPTDSHGAIGLPGIDFNSAKLYVFFHRHYNFSIANPDNWGSRGLNLKPLRMWSDTGNNAYIGYQGSEGVESGRLGAERTGTTTVWTGDDLPQVKNTWSQEELIYKTSDIGVKNGRFDIVRDGITPYDESFQMRTSDGYTESYSRLYLDQISNGVNDSANLLVSYDNLYIDDTHQRVYVSSESTFSQAEIRSVQVPLEWSDSSITIQYDPSLLRDQAKFLYVVNDKGEVNSQGFEICKDDCVSSPNPPNQLDVK